MLYPPPPPPPHTISISTDDKDGAEVALDASLFSSLASMDTSIKKENGEKEEDDYSLYTLQDLGYKTEDIAEHGTARYGTYTPLIIICRGGSLRLTLLSKLTLSLLFFMQYAIP